MKALILVGGFGTRLRPLTLTLPKPLVEFGNKPMILHQIESLAKAGVTDIVLAVNYRPEVMVTTLKKYEKEYGVRITFSVETEPLGTAGPIALASEILNKDNSPFFVLNSDIICDFPFGQLLEYHNRHGKEGTIVVTKVEEPSKYGVVVTEGKESDLIGKFVEKPKDFVSNKINAGIYMFNTDIIKRIPLRATSIEKEVFPLMAEQRQLCQFILEGYWMDIGQPKDFLTGTCLYLNNLAMKNSKLLSDPSLPFINGSSVLIGDSVEIGDDCLIGPNVTIGSDVVIGRGVRLQRCVILRGARIQDHAWIRNSIIGWHSSVGRWARVEGVTVLGDDVAVKDEVYINGGSVLPHKNITSNITEPQIIM